MIYDDGVDNIENETDNTYDDNEVADQYVADQQVF
jgi:hypothetical protein